MKLLDQTRSRGATLPDVLIKVLVAFFFLALFFLYIIPTFCKLVRPSSPPRVGIVNSNAAPIVFAIEQHLGKDWIIVAGKTNTDLAVYYDNTTTIKSARKVGIDIGGDPTGQAAHSIMHVIAYEVAAEYSDNPVQRGFPVEGNGYGRTQRMIGCFTMQPVRPDVEMSFIGLYPSTFKNLKSELLSLKVVTSESTLATNPIDWQRRKGPLYGSQTQTK